MVKIAFNSALAQKALGKEAPADVKVSGRRGARACTGRGRPALTVDFVCLIHARYVSPLLCARLMLRGFAVFCLKKKKN